MNVQKRVLALTRSAYRSGIAAADVLSASNAAPMSAETAGSLSAGTYYYQVVAVNSYGWALPGSIGSIALSGTERAGLIINASTGATHYDIYFSKDSAPKFLTRLTAAQRTQGIQIDSAGNISINGAIAPKVVTDRAGTGAQAPTSANGYIIPTADPINCGGYEYIDADIFVKPTDGGGAPTVVVVPFFKNTAESGWFQGKACALSFGGADGEYDSLRQRLRVECRGNEAVHLLVAKLSGCAVDIYPVLS